MTDKQPEALRLAGLLELAPEDGVEPQTAEDAAAELRLQHTRIAELEARIKTMAEEHADELMVAHLDGRMCGRSTEPTGEYPLLPEHVGKVEVSTTLENSGLRRHKASPAYTSDQRRAYVDRAMRAEQPAGAQQPAPHSEPWYGHQFKEVRRGYWQCSCGKAIAEAVPSAGKDSYPPLPNRYAYDDDGGEMFTADHMRAYAAAAHAMRASHGQAPAQAAPAAVAGCTRSHPHENMDSACRAKAAIAEMQNRAARGAEATAHDLERWVAMLAAAPTQPAPQQEPIKKGGEA